MRLSPLKFVPKSIADSPYAKWALDNFKTLFPVVKDLETKMSADPVWWQINGTYCDPKTRCTMPTGEVIDYIDTWRDAETGAIVNNVCTTCLKPQE